MGFILETYSDNSANLVVSFQEQPNSLTYFNTDSINEAMNYFNLTLNDSNQLEVKQQNEQAIEDLGIPPQDAEEFRIAVDSLIATMDEETALENIVLFKLWQPDILYNKNDRIRFGDNLYECIQGHTSQNGWEPPVVPALWRIFSVEEYPNWIQPMGAHNSYIKGATVTHNDKKWVSEIDNNVWEPGVYGWKEIIEKNLPAQEWNSDSTYQRGDKVLHNEQNWFSLLNNNINNEPIEGEYWTMEPNEWESGKIYNKDDKVKFLDNYYQSLIESNTSIPENSENWITITLLYPEYNSDNSYNTGDIVFFENSNYKSLIDNNIWSPSAYPEGWENLDLSETPIEDEYPEFKQPTGYHDAYNIGDKVTFNGKKYICLLNGCAWSPSDYPQAWEEVVE